jgi:hypothetical protein
MKKKDKKKGTGEKKPWGSLASEGGSQAAGIT